MPESKFQRYRVKGTKCHRSKTVLIAALLFIVTLSTNRATYEYQGTYVPIITTLGTRAFDLEYELWYYVGVVFESEVEKKANGYEYRYRLTNKGDTQVRVEWRALENSTFGDSADNIEELRMGLLDPDTVSEWLVLTSQASPRVSKLSANMFGHKPSGSESAQHSGPAPAYVPDVEAQRP